MASELESPIISVKSSTDRSKYPSLLPVVSASNPPLTTPRRQPVEIITDLQRRLSRSSSPRISPNTGVSTTGNSISNGNTTNGNTSDHKLRNSISHSSIPLRKNSNRQLTTSASVDRSGVARTSTMSRSQSHTALDYQSVRGGGILNYSTSTTTPTTNARDHSHKQLHSASYATPTAASQRRSRVLQQPTTSPRSEAASSHRLSSARHTSLASSSSLSAPQDSEQRKSSPIKTSSFLERPIASQSTRSSTSNGSGPGGLVPPPKSALRSRIHGLKNPSDSTASRQNPHARADSQEYSRNLRSSTRKSLSPPALQVDKAPDDVPPVPPLPEQIKIGRHKQIPTKPSHMGYSQTHHHLQNGHHNGHHSGGKQHPNHARLNPQTLEIAKRERVRVHSNSRSNLQSNAQLSSHINGPPDKMIAAKHLSSSYVSNSGNVPVDPSKPLQHQHGTRKVSRVAGPRLPPSSLQQQHRSFSTDHLSSRTDVKPPQVPAHGPTMTRSNTFNSFQQHQQPLLPPPQAPSSMASIMSSPARSSPLRNVPRRQDQSPTKPWLGRIQQVPPPPPPPPQQQNMNMGAPNTFTDGPPRSLNRTDSDISVNSMSSMTSIAMPRLSEAASSSSTRFSFASDKDSGGELQKTPTSGTFNKPWTTSSGRSSLASHRSSNGSMSSMAATLRMMMSPFSRQSRRSNASKLSVSKLSTQSTTSLASLNTTNKQELEQPRVPNVYIPMKEPTWSEMEEIRDALMSMITTKPDSGTVRKEFEIMKRETPSLVAAPLTPPVASRRYKLNLYEKGEILDYKEVYYCGRKDIQKISGELQRADNNYNFDDKNGNYRVVVGDHLAYRYRILAVLGMGSFGKVLHCVDHKTGQFVAVKMIINSKQFHMQALVEVELLKTLSALNTDKKYPIVSYMDHFTFRDHLCISTELLGINLYELIKYNNYRGLSPCLVKHFARQITQALAFLESRKIIHCDLKPENVLLSDIQTGGIKLIDLGGSCYETEKVYTYIQSRFYRSPEIMLGMSYNTKVDVWSLGCILPELVTAKPLFSGSDEQEQVAYIIEMLGPPDPNLIRRYSRRGTFFDNMGNPKNMMVKRHGTKERRLLRPYGKNLERDFLRSAADPILCDFVRKLLTWDPQKRIGALEALDHPYLASSSED